MTATNPHPHRKGRFFAVAGLLFFVFMAYRVVTVYTVRSGECRPRAIDRTLRYETRDAEGHTVSFPIRDGMPEQKRPLTVMTFNIEGYVAFYDPSHTRKIAETINALHPDIVGLQEVHQKTWQVRFHNQAAELAGLTGMHSFFGKSYSTYGGEFGNEILTRGDIISATVHPLPSVGEPRSVIDSIIRIDGVTINFYVAHLTAWERLNRASRAEQLACLEKHVASSRYPYVLVGDFNSPPEAPEVKAFIDARPAQICGAEIGPSHKYLKERIDYIFADWGWDVRSARVERIGSSDHWPVVTELMWRRPRSTTPSPSGIGHEPEKQNL